MGEIVNFPTLRFRKGEIVKSANAFYICIANTTENVPAHEHEGVRGANTLQALEIESAMVQTLAIASVEKTSPERDGFAITVAMLRLKRRATCTESRTGKVGAIHSVRQESGVWQVSVKWVGGGFSPYLHLDEVDFFDPFTQNALQS